MKINEELQRLLSVEQYRKQGQTAGISGGEGFESMLARQLGRADAPKDANALAAPADRLANMSVATLAGLENADADKSLDDQLLESLSGGIASTLDGFDKMAASLQSRNPDALKTAWSALQGLDGEIAGLRADLGKLSKPDTELESMLNELEILAVTEKFKFNRGDYL